MRLDLWLWATRIYKTRTRATDAIKGGHVRLGEKSAKPGNEVRPGDTITVRINQMTRTLRVVAAPPSRISAKDVRQYLEDLTPDAEYERRCQVQNLIPAGFRPKGTGRPTKRERRALEDIGQA